MTSIPPTIPPDNQFTSNRVRLQRIDNDLTSDSIYVPNSALSTFSILSGGTLSNLNDPVEDNQAATLAYVLANIGGATPEGPQYAVQYNDGGIFGGNSNLLFNSSTNTMTAQLITNGTVNIGSGTITNLAVPTADDQAATKIYAENAFSMSRTTDNTVGPVTYTASEMANGIISRNITGGGTITDVTADAADIVALGGSVGTSYTVLIRNDSTDYDSIIRIDATSSMGTDVTMVSGISQNIYPGYTYIALLKITSVAPPRVDMITMYNTRTLVNSSFNYRDNKQTAYINVLQATDYILNYYNTFNTGGDLGVTTLVTTTQYHAPMGPTTYYGRSIGLDRRYSMWVLGDVTGTAANATDSTNNRIVFIGYTESVPGKKEFYIRNPSTSSDNAVIDPTKTFFGTQPGVGTPPGDEQFIFMDSNSLLTIPPGYTGKFLAVNNNTSDTVLIYTLGIHPTTA